MTDKDAKGYELKKTANNVTLLPISETKVLPYNDKQLDNQAKKIKLVNGLLSVTPLRLAIYYMNSRKTRKRANRTLSNELYSLERFITFLNTTSNPEDYSNDKSIFEGDFKNWLIKRGHPEGAIGKDINNLNHMIAEGYLLDGTDHLKNEAVMHIKRDGAFYQQEYNSFPTLDQLYPEADINSNDLDLLIGLRETMVWYLNEMQQLRKNITENLPPNLINYYKELKENKISPLSYNNNFALLSSDRCKDSTYDKLTVDLVDTILKENNNVANEIMFCEMYNKSGFQKDYLEDLAPYTSDDIKKYFDFMLTDYSSKSSGNRNNYIKGIYKQDNSRLSRKQRVTAFFPSLSFLVYPTVDESLAMEWLLSSERIQWAGLTSLNLNDNILLDTKNKTFQIVNIVKWRSVGPQATNIYKNDSIYKVHLNWVELISNAKKYMTDITDKYIPKLVRSSLQRRKQKDFHYLRKSFWLMCIENTQTNKAILSDVKGSKNEQHVKDFLKLLKVHMLKVKKSVNAKALKTNPNQAQQNKNNSTRKSHTTTEYGIGLKVIAQTRAILDGNIMSGRLVGHTQKTHDKDYINRTRSKFVNAQSATFAADIGNAMKEEAERFVNMSEFVTIDEIKEMLNINKQSKDEINELRNIVEVAEKEGFLSELTTELKKAGKTYIIQTPWTAALIKGQIKHIDSEKSSIEFNNRHKKYDIELRQMYLNLILSRFPAKILEEADGILEEYDNIPYPSMV